MLTFLSTWLVAAQMLVTAAADEIIGTFVHNAGRWKMTFDIDKDSRAVLTFEVPGREPFVGMPFPLSGGPGTYTLDDKVYSKRVSSRGSLFGTSASTLSSRKLISHLET
ncbi:hypothetical protein FOL46_005161 [Perkinsus olseni]|uniref:Uncharacterized protein n=1 Tax=Perkinsus olseni TaxID=32597 RepID=A0A7J6LV69_PEROL|nr:hypothetical protein FOL46_005161 [Perkinsus olseni]